MAENETLWTWGNQQKYHADLENYIGTKITEHSSDAVSHITADERTAWNGKTTIDECAETFINPNLIINSNFKINQRGISGTFTSIGAYFVDMWKLVEGSVTVNTDGTITLNGTICQVRESSINGDFLAYASAGTASYDDATKTYTLTANGETISWAMLVYGKVKVPFVDPDEALELVKCQRCFERVQIPINKHLIANMYLGLNHCSYNVTYTKKRTIPTIVPQSFGRFVNPITQAGAYLETFEIETVTDEFVSIQSTWSAAQAFTERVMGWVDALGYVDVSAEL